MLSFGTQQRNEASMWIAKLSLHYGSGLVFLQYGKLWLYPHSPTKHYMACRTSDWKPNGKLIQRTYWHLDTYNKNLALVLLCRFLHTDLFASLHCPSLFIWHDQAAARGSSLLLEAIQPCCVPAGLPALESLHRRMCKLTCILSSQERTCTCPPPLWPQEAARHTNALAIPAPGNPVLAFSFSFPPTQRSGPLVAAANSIQAVPRCA